MRKALLVFLFGLMLMLGSCVPYGLIAYRAFNAEVVYQQGISVGETITTDTIVVDTDTLIQPALELTIKTHVIETRDTVDDHEHRPQYQFPLHYSVVDHRGAILFEERVVLDPGGTRHNVKEWVSGDSARLKYEKALEKINVPSPGRIQVRVHIDPDDIYRAQLQSARLLVYDSVHQHGPLVVLGVVLGVVGFITLIIGVIALLAGSGVRPVPAQDSAPAQIATPSRTVQQYAGFLHLSGLLSHVIPLGGLIAQIIMWLIKKDEDDFIKAHGATAINFRLSMLIYKLIAFVLIFTILLLPFALVALVVLAVLDIVFVIVAAVSAFQGRPYEYPLAIRFLR